MPHGLSRIVAATVRWLLGAYPPVGGALGAALAEAQARQAATVAAWLRYPTAVDAALLDLLGPGGSARLEWLVGADPATGSTDPDTANASPTQAWRTWVDEVVASWAACLLSEPELAAAAVAALAGSEHAGGLCRDFPRLLAPDDHDRRAAALLRHPDLLDAVADLHRGQLVARLRGG